MRRREFIALIAIATAWPLSAGAEQMPVIALLNPLPSPEAMPHLVAGFWQGLAEEGYVEGKNVTIEYHYINFKPELMQQAVRDVVQRKVNVIFASTPDAIAAARSATSSIPTVAVDLESDPVAMGYVKSLARPGGNLTGVFLDLPELSGKQIGLLKEIVPRLSRIAIFGNPDLNGDAATAEAVKTAAVEAEVLKVQVADDWGPALEAAKKGQDQAGILLSSPLVWNSSKQVGELALTNRLPLISLFSEYPKVGGLISYGPSVAAIWQRSGAYIGKILHGAKPNDLPIQRPEKFDLVINLKTAAALGLDMPTQLQQLADEVIE